MLHSAKARVGPPARIAAAARRELAGLSRPAASFDASRYFRGTPDLGFFNVGTSRVRQIAREIVAANRATWSMDEAMAFADVLIRDRHLESKGLAVEVVARYHRAFAPRHLAAWKRWLANDYSANWATTDAICGMLIGPLLLEHPAQVRIVASWCRHRNLWVRRASAVGIIASARKGRSLDTAYSVARVLHDDAADLIQKAVGWMLREAGKPDMPRLERYLRANGSRIPRTTLRYAIEWFPPARRRDLLAATRVNGR